MNRRFSKAMLRELIERKLTGLNAEYVGLHPRGKCIDPGDGCAQCQRDPTLMWIYGQWRSLSELLLEVDP